MGAVDGFSSANNPNNFFFFSLLQGWEGAKILALSEISQIWVGETSFENVYTSAKWSACHCSHGNLHC